jgi:clan AA aspartic protease
MILGKFVDGRVVLPVNFCIDKSTDFKIDCVVDTGFNDYLTLPPQVVAVMNLPLYSTTLVRLADGSQYSIPIHSAKIRWDRPEKVVPVLATGIKPLLGTALLNGFCLTVEFINDGMIKIEKM